MKTDNVKILIIDDEKQVRKFLRVCLQAHDYDILEAETGQSGIEMAALEKPNLIILDLGLPDMDGFEVLAKLREWTKTPILILSVRESETEKVKLLDAGANDYMTKPFNTGELMARIRVALRHAYTQEGKNPVLVFEHVRIDFPHHLVYVDDKKIDLTKKEYDIVRILASNAGKIVTHEQLLSEVWGEIYKDNIEYLRTYIAQIRRKIEKDPAQPKLIMTESGLGYRFKEPDHE